MVEAVADAFSFDEEAAAEEEDARRRDLINAQQQGRLAQAKEAVAAEAALAEGVGGSATEEAARKALEKRISQALVRMFTEFLGVALSETIVYLLVPFVVMNFQLLFVTILRRGQPLGIPGFPPSLMLHGLDLWEILLILAVDLVVFPLAIAIALMPIILVFALTGSLCALLPDAVCAAFTSLVL